jgi:SAM-dependent methyltransferase
MRCTVCGSVNFTARDVLWPKLITDWQLSSREVQYINAQQGKSCDTCGANLRSVVLANAIRSFMGSELLLRELMTHKTARRLTVLELNEAGSLSPVLRTMSKYTFGAYPEVDMRELPYPDGSFDLVVHSDTLEHIPNPIAALRECRRVLKVSGALCLTVPIVVGRMSRSREGLPKSFHGNEAQSPDDFVVHTEFGADAWTYVLEAGFSRVEFHTVEFPAAIALLARKTNDA